MLALAVAAFAGMINAAVSRGEYAASWRSAGADAVVNASQLAGGLTTAAQRAIAAVPGAQQTAAVSVTESAVSGGSGVAVAGIDPDRYAALVAATPWPALPRVLPERAPGTAGPGGGDRGAVPVVASPAAAAQLGRGVVRLPLSYGQIPVRVAATVRGTPALAGTASFVLLPRWALLRVAYPPPPALMLVTGEHLDQRALTAVVRRALPGASVSFRSAALAALAGAPLQHAAGVFFAEGVVLAAGFGGIILLLGLGMGARARDQSLARLRVLGISRGQARLLLAAETLPQVLAAVIGGLACAWLLAPLIGPDLDLSVFTGSTASVQVRPDYLALALPAAGLLVLAVAVLVIQAAAAGRRGAGAALRIGG